MIELDKPNICENKLSGIIQEELFRSLKLETEELIKKMVEQLNDLKTSIKVNEAKFIDEKEEYKVNKDQLQLVLETEKNRIKNTVKKDTGSELAKIQTKGDAVKTNLLLQYNSLKDINERLIEQYNNLANNLEALNEDKSVKIEQIKIDMFKNYEISGKDNLGKIETALANIKKTQQVQISELKSNKSKLTEVIKNLDLKKRMEIKDIYGYLIRKNRTNGKRQTAFSTANITTGL